MNFYDRFVINNIKLNKNNILKLSLKEREELIPPIINKIKENELVINLPIEEIKNEYELLKLSKIQVENDEINNFTSDGDILCKIYCNNFFDVKVNNRTSVREAFNNEELMIRLIKNKLGLDSKNNFNPSNITMSGIVNGLKSMGFCLTASVFKSSNAKAIYEELTEIDDVVLDYSAGWGARMLGAASCGRKYIGIDPINAGNLQRMGDELGLSDIKIIQDKSEEIDLQENSIDFAFSSPPYFNFEPCSKENEQSYNKGEEYFYDVYWRETLNKIKKALKNNKFFAVNIRNEKMLEIASETFGLIKREIKISTPVSHLTKKKQNEKAKNEIVYIYLNEKLN